MTETPWKRSKCLYQPFYCEENVWRLLQDLDYGARSAWAVFVAGPIGQVWMTGQRASEPGTVISWDYHVVAMVRAANEEAWVLDLDSRLPFPTPLFDYVRGSFPDAAPLGARPRFRPVSAPRYVRDFKSDRRHMRRDDGSFVRPPPPWDPPSASQSNLAGWLSPVGDGLGPWVDASGLVSWLCS